MLTVRVPHLREELHLGWLERIFLREAKPSSEEATLTGYANRAMFRKRT